MKYAIAIPARYGSTRLPGKPLAMIAGKTMLERVLEVAHRATEGLNVNVFVATDHHKIKEHAQELGADCILTPVSCPTGSDRVLSAIRQLDYWPDFVINLQGDAPFTPPSVIRQMFEACKNNPKLEVITPVHRLSWDDLDILREKKKTTPYSGTTAIINKNGRALWFSKNIIPAIRKEEELRKEDTISPIHQHMGLYGFRTDILETFCMLEQGEYEVLEGLEQLRMLENNIRIQTIQVDIDNGTIQSGVDSPKDLERAAKFIKKFGEPFA